MVTEVAVHKVTGGAFGRDAVEALVRRNGEPEWLRERRLAAWELADRLPFPTSRERAWKYFDPTRLRLQGADLTLPRASQHGTDLPPRPPSPDLTPQPPSLKGRGGKRRQAVGTGAARAMVRLVQDAGGRIEQPQAAALPEGVIFSTLGDAVRQQPELVRKHLGALVPAEQNVFVALNAALWTGGVFMYVPRDTRVDVPLHALARLAAEDGAVFPRVLIVLERGGELSFVEEHEGGGDTTFVDAVTELVLADDATLHHSTVQRWNAGVQELFSTRADLGRGAHLVSALAGVGGSLHKGWIDSRIRGAGALSEIFGAVFGTGDQHFDLVTTQDHIGDHSVSDLLIKSALMDRSLSAYYGVTRINPSARMANANQEDRNLLLSDKAKAEAEPVLEILTSEVARCAHAASAGPVDEEQLFYLECRGIARPAAERLLIQGFLGQVFQRVPLESVRTMMEDAVTAKLGD